MLVTNIVEVKSINLLFEISNILCPDAFFHAIGIWPCMDLDSIFDSLDIKALVPTAGTFLNIWRFLVFIIFFH